MHTHYNNGGRVGQEGTPVLLIDPLVFLAASVFDKKQKELASYVPT